MEVSLALFADYANVSQEGKLNVLGIFSLVQVKTLPGGISQCQLVLRLVADAVEKGSEKEIAFKLVDPDGKLLFDQSGKFAIPRDGRPGPVSFELLLPMRLGFERYGPHRFCILINGELKATIEVGVMPPLALQSDPDA
jgi:hypothetical protein